MELIKKQTNIDFMSQRYLALVLSLVLVAVSIGSLAMRGLNYGLDFTGGTLIEVGYEQSIDLAEVRATLTDAGYGNAVVQTFGTARDIVIRIPPQGEESSADLSTAVLEALRADAEGGVDMRRVEFVGPQVGNELKNKGVQALLWALAGILIYVTVRFEYRFSLGAVAALAHDVLITVGVFSLLQMEFDLTVLAALLAVIGYSLNDTIVVYDRVRENFRVLRKGDSKFVLNRSVNQMLSRTLMTSLTTLLVLGALFVFGGEIIHSFAFALIIGVLIGTYSSIYVAGTAALALGVSRQDLMPVKKEGEEQQGAQV